MQIVPVVKRMLPCDLTSLLRHFQIVLSTRPPNALVSEEDQFFFWNLDAMKRVKKRLEVKTEWLLPCRSCSLSQIQLRTNSASHLSKSFGISWSFPCRNSLWEARILEPIYTCAWLPFYILIKENEVMIQAKLLADLLRSLHLSCLMGMLIKQHSACWLTFGKGNLVGLHWSRHPC